MTPLSIANSDSGVDDIRRSLPLRAMGGSKRLSAIRGRLQFAKHFFDIQYQLGIVRKVGELRP